LVIAVLSFDHNTLVDKIKQMIPALHRCRGIKPAMVLFGATGDLTKRLVMPALYNLSRTKALPEKFALIGVARAEGTAESWRDHQGDRGRSSETIRAATGDRAPRHGSAAGPNRRCWRRTADMLVHEVLSRPMRDRRAVARYAGLTGAPDESGANRGSPEPATPESAAA
jgi:hypothetical protein